MKTTVLAAVLLALAAPAYANTQVHKHHRHVVASAVIPAMATASVPYASASDGSSCHAVAWSTWDFPPFVGTACGPQ